uniref:3-deoxy-manno-octulosonate cytidylyltransferase n=1 Tax=Candidatus Aschnera chinzeii TaxID=1485666 RepID=A0AAT9G561_9ENTR|nr:MAG: 3-deoxy-manno-octulosonate cytidylyltransferase [Candidatus Aschnera chinzeii]
MNTKNNFTIIIPARFGSSRLPGKPLIEIHGKPMIIRVVEQAIMSYAKRVIVATDHPEIFNIVKQKNYEVCMTKNIHCSGTERISEVINKYKFSDEEIIINLQGDEPLINPKLINKIAKNTLLNKYDLVTLATKIINPKDISNTNIVKVIVNKDNNAIYFSRTAIPWQDNKSSKHILKINKEYLRHIGIYGYSAGFIREYNKWPQCSLEKIENLEQLRVLWNAKIIHVIRTSCNYLHSVDNQSDLEYVRKNFLILSKHK